MALVAAILAIWILLTIAALLWLDWKYQHAPRDEELWPDLREEEDEQP